MKLIYLYTNLNWYRIELFRSISKLMDCKIFILNGYTVGYKNIEYKPEYDDLDITFLSPEESSFKRLCKILNKEEFDSIVIPSMNDAFYLNLSTKLAWYYSKIGKTVLYFWEYWPMDKGTYNIGKWIKQQIRHFYTKLNRNKISYFITPSINTYSFYQRMNIPSWKLIRCPNVSEINHMGEMPSGVRATLGIHDNEKVILFFGRVEEYKGIHELISAFKKLKRDDWHLVICGPGEERITRETTGCNNIHVLGSIRPEERYNYYIATDIFVLPNTYKGKVEPWGLTVNEAMSCGVPIIATNATGSAVDLVISGLNGYIVNANRLEVELGYYIQKILTDDDLKKQMGEHSRKMVSEYTFDNMALAFYVATEKGNLISEG